MRPSDYKTTLAHDTILGLSDTAGAINELPNIGVPETIIATGTISVITLSRNNLHRYLKVIIRRAGLKLCPRIFQALRQTELVQAPPNMP